MSSYNYNNYRSHHNWSPPTDPSAPPRPPKVPLQDESQRFAGKTVPQHPPQHLGSNFGGSGRRLVTDQWQMRQQQQQPRRYSAPAASHYRPQTPPYPCDDAYPPSRFSQHTAQHAPPLPPRPAPVSPADHPGAQQLGRVNFHKELEIEVPYETGGKYANEGEGVMRYTLGYTKLLDLVLQNPKIDGIEAHNALRGNMEYDVPVSRGRAPTPEEKAPSVAKAFEAAIGQIKRDLKSYGCDLDPKPIVSQHSYASAAYGNPPHAVPLRHTPPPYPQDLYSPTGRPPYEQPVQHSHVRRDGRMHFQHASQAHVSTPPRSASASPVYANPAGTMPPRRHSEPARPPSPAPQVPARPSSSRPSTMSRIANWLSRTQSAPLTPQAQWALGVQGASFEQMKQVKAEREYLSRRVPVTSLLTDRNGHVLGTTNVNNLTNGMLLDALTKIEQREGLAARMAATNNDVMREVDANKENRLDTTFTRNGSHVPQDAPGLVASINYDNQLRGEMNELSVRIHELKGYRGMPLRTA